MSYEFIYVNIQMRVSYDEKDTCHMRRRIHVK